MDASSVTNPPGSIPGDARPPRFTGRMFIGLMVIAVGVLFLLDAFGVPGLEDVWHQLHRFWPAVFVFVGLAKFANTYTTGGRISASVWILLGVLLIANNLDLLDFSVWRVFWPVVIILFGVGLLSRSMSGRLYGNARPQTDSHFTAFALWSSVVRKISSPDFRGGDASAIMGGCEIDLRQCGLASGPATIDLFVLMGGVEVMVPGDWIVRNDGIVIMGGFEDSRKETAGDPSRVLILRGTVLMGGVEIKN